MAQMVKNLPAMQETQGQSLGQENPLEKGMATTPLFLPGEFHGKRSLACYSLWGCKGSDMTRQLTFHFLFLGVESRIQYFQKPQLLSEEKAENHRMKEQVPFNNFYFLLRNLPNIYLNRELVDFHPPITKFST